MSTPSPAFRLAGCLGALLALQGCNITIPAGLLNGSAIPETARDQALDAPTPLLSAERLQVIREAA